jgi:hypothetical protein
MGLMLDLIWADQPDFGLLGRAPGRTRLKSVFKDHFFPSCLVVNFSGMSGSNGDLINQVDIFY